MPRRLYKRFDPDDAAEERDERKADNEQLRAEEEAKELARRKEKKDADHAGHTGPGPDGRTGR